MDSVVHVFGMTIGILLILVVGIVLLFIIIFSMAYSSPKSSGDNMLAMRKFVKEKYDVGELDKHEFRDAYRMIGYWVSNPWDYVPPECQELASERRRTLRKYLSMNGIERSSKHLDKEKTLAVILDYCEKHQDLVRPQVIRDNTMPNITH